MSVGAVSGVGAGSSGISPILIEQYKRLNKELKLKRLAAKRSVDPLIGDLQPRVETYEETISPEEIRYYNSHPLSAQIPVKIAYTIIQRISEYTSEDQLDKEALKLAAWRVYCG